MNNTENLVLDLSEKLILVTGAAGNLGSSISQSLLEQGCRLILVDKDKARLNHLAEELPKTKSSNVYLSLCDLENQEERDRVFGGISTDNPVIDGVVNCAAFVGDSSLEGWSEAFQNQSVETWRRALEVNLTSMFHIMQILLSSLNNSDSASVVNVSSIYGDKGPKWEIYEGTSLGNPAAYAVSKGGLNQLTRWLATTLAPRIRVNAVLAGGIERGQPLSFKNKYTNDVPLGRMAKERDLVGPVLFLLSDLSSYITGEMLRVDGGRSVW